jgi:hypothetical protein
MDKNGILIQLSTSDRTKIGKEPIADQSVPQKEFSAIWVVESEVNNGGFSQYFYHDMAETSPFVVRALEIVGAPKTADICQRAIVAAFPEGYPGLSEAVREAAADFSDDQLETLGALDQQFFSYPHNLTDLLFEFVSGHPEEFGELPSPRQ